MKRRLIVLGMGILSACALPVCAQTTGNVAVGASLVPRRGIDSLADGRTTVGPLLRIGHGRQGFGLRYGLNWFATDVETRVGGLATGFGELHIRPIMGGYGYTRTFGGTAVSVGALAGYAFTSFERLPAFDEAYRRARDAAYISSDVSNALVIKPEISSWIDLGRKTGLNISLGYMVARPEVTIDSTAGRDVHRVKADMLMFSIGAVYSVF